MQCRFSKPKHCPVCLGSIHQTRQPLECGHWVHRSCIRKSGKAKCPICRKQLTGIKVIDLSSDSGEEAEVIQIPENLIIMAVMSYQLFCFILLPQCHHFGLEHFVDAAITTVIPRYHPSYEWIFTTMYGEALHIYFDSFVR